jgi:hypothetical protein
MRQYKLFILFIQVMIHAEFAEAGFERTAQPAAAFGRALSGIAFESESNVWLNPAVISGVSSFRTSFFYSPFPFQLPQLKNYGVLIADDIGIVKASASVTSIGFSLYRETAGLLTLAYTNVMDFSFGASLSFNHLNIANYGNAMRVGIDAGMLYSLTDKLKIGAAVTNLNGFTFGDDDDVPRIVVSGASFQVNEMIILCIDLVKDVRYKPTYRAGIELKPLEIFTIRTGIQGEPSRLFGGIGIRISSFIIDYGIGTHDDLGLTHSIGISLAP